VGDDDLQKEIRGRLQQDYNITMGKFTNTTGNSRCTLAVSGNGWAGATAMRSLFSGSCTLFVNDTYIYYEDYTRDFGEIYFPFLKPNEDVVVVDYDNIAQAARTLNAKQDKEMEICKNGLRFAKRYLGWIAHLMSLNCWLRITMNMLARMSDCVFAFASG